MAEYSKTIIETDKGKVRGEYENGLFTFKGIPYAAPPIGEKRWLPPEPREPWQGILEASEFGAISPQITVEPTDFQVPGFSVLGAQSEDCLYLNIWTSKLEAASLPVMVWIHGGGFNTGSGSQPISLGDILALRGDVVMVTLNYRLGILGFLNLNEVTGGRIPATGNNGLLDQIAALQWIKNNISAFGGDPDNITVFGESAGGMSIGCLMAIPAARGLFHKAILESGTGAQARPLDQCVEMSESFLEATGLKSNNTTGLREISVSRILEAQEKLTLKSPGGVTPVAPVVDGKVIPKRPLDAIKEGAAKGIITIVGNNLEECKLFRIRRPELATADEATLSQICSAFIPKQHISRVIDTYKKARNERGESTSPSELMAAIQTDVMFRIPVTRTLEAQCQNGMAAYHYLFTWKSPALNGLLGACHALEIGFVFGRLDDKFCGSGPEAEQLSRKVQDGWVAFARYGNPSCESLGEWTAYCERRKTMMLGQECHVEEVPYEEERRIWGEIDGVGPVA